MEAISDVFKLINDKDYQHIIADKWREAGDFFIKEMQEQQKKQVSKMNQLENRIIDLENKSIELAMGKFNETK